MATILQTGYKFPQTWISNGQVTDIPWSNPDNLLLVDDLLSESNPGAGVASDVIIGNYNFDIPQGAVIVGIQMKLIAKRGAQTSPVITISPNFVDNSSGQDVFYPYVTPFTGLTPDLDEHILGGPNYQFASQFTVDQINAGKFQLVSNGDVYVDCMLVNIFYYIPNPLTPIPDVAEGCIDCDSVLQIQAMYLNTDFLAGETKFYLKPGSLAYPDGTPAQPGDTGTCGGTVTFVFDEGKPKVQGSNWEENVNLPYDPSDVATPTWTVLTDGVIEVDIKTIQNRGLGFHTPYAHDPDLMSDHNANSKVIISNNGPWTFSILKKCHIGVLVSPVIPGYDEDVLIEDVVTSINAKGAGITLEPDPAHPNGGIILNVPGNGVQPPQVVGTGSGTTGQTPDDEIEYDLPVSGVDRGGLVQVSYPSARTVTGVTINGTPATLAITNLNGAIANDQWFLLAPPVGTLTVVVTLDAPALFCSGAEALVGVDQANPIGATQSATGNSNDAQQTLVTTQNNSLVIDGITTNQVPILYTPFPAQTVNWEHTANSDTPEGASSTQTAGTAPDNVVMRWSLTQVTPWVVTAVEINGITSSSADEKVKATTTDTTPGYLDQKLQPGSGITFTVLNPGGNEAIEISSTGGGGGTGNNLQTDQTPDNGTYGLLAGAVDGVNDTFTVSLGSYVTGTLVVFLNGLIQLQGVSDDWVQVSTGLGTFSFNVPPQTGDIITAQYQSTGGGVGAQAGIQFENEGVNLGTPGTVDEVDFTGPGVTASRVGNKVTVNVPGGGGGGGAVITLTAGETINGASSPKAVFVGTNSPVGIAAVDGNSQGNGINSSMYDTYGNAHDGSASTARVSGEWYAYEIPGQRCYNEIVFETGTNSPAASVPIEIEFYNTGVTEPTGVPFYTKTSTITQQSTGSGLRHILRYLGDTVDCSPVLGGGNKYWVVVKLGVVTGPLETSGYTLPQPTMREWNGSAWVLPMKKPVGMEMALIPEFGEVFNSKGDDIFGDSFSGTSSPDGYLSGRKCFLGFVIDDVVAGDPVDVQILGKVTFPVPIPGNESLNAQLGTGLGDISTYVTDDIAPTQLRVGTRTGSDEIIINKNTLVPMARDGQYQ